MEEKNKHEQKCQLQAYELGLFGQKMNKLKTIEKIYLSGVVDGATLRILGEKINGQIE